MNRMAATESAIEGLVEAFENATLAAAAFDHEAHVLVAWHYLRDLTLLEAIARFTRAIKRLTQQLGLAGKYHETLTCFYLLKIAERRQANPHADWRAFKAANPDLFARRPRLIDRYYSKRLLESQAARRSFVLPDLI